MHVGATHFAQGIAIDTRRFMATQAVLAPDKPPAIRAVIKRISQVTLFAVAWGVICFGSAGTTHWLRGWIYMALSAGGLVVSSVLVVMLNPATVAARGKWHRDVKGYDKAIVLLTTLLTLCLPVLAGFDAGRYHWSSLPFATVYLGAALHVLGTVPAVWAMIVNPFLETGVRIQTERAHRVIDAGPYRLVRHPMYAGVLTANLAVPLVLGSLWTFVPAALLAALFVTRTALEDRTLRRELPGYEEYSQRTRYRLIPGVW